MAIANKLEIIYDSCKDIRDVITEKNSSLGKGSITTLGSDVTKICNPNSYIHKVNINPQELQHLDNENITIENYGNAGNTKTRGAIYIPLAGAYNWTATFTINDGSILQYACGITAAVPTTGVDVTSITYSGWKTTGSGTTSYSTAANCNYLYLMATYIDGATGIPTFEEFVSNATFSLIAYGKNGSVREDDYVGPNYTSIAYGKNQNDLNLSNVIIPDTVTTIGNNAFEGCYNLNYINLENVKTVNHAAFKNCTNLKSINFPTSITTINESAFENCTNLEVDLNLPNLTTMTAMSVFNGSGITSISSLGHISKMYNNSGYYGPFKGCKKLTEITLPNELIDLNGGWFRDCTSLTTIHWNSNNITRVNYTFQNTRLEIDDLSLPSLTYLGQWSFSDTRIKKVSNLGSITTLDESSASYVSSPFYNCRLLEEITLPATFTNFKRRPFRKCTSLNKVIMLCTTPPTTVATISYMFEGASAAYNTCKFYVPYSEDHSVLNAYQTATNWSAVASRIFELNSDGSIPS